MYDHLPTSIILNLPSDQTPANTFNFHEELALFRIVNSLQTLSFKAQIRLRFLALVTSVANTIPF